MKAEKKLFDDLKKEVEEIIGIPEESIQKLKAICMLLYDSIDYYDWVGFYIVDGSKRELILGPFIGEPTEHARIPFGRGICGQAAESGRTIIVQDVTRETNYISCAPEVKSEIVVPIFRSGMIAGELDIDSRCRSPFTQEDRDLLEHICRIIPDIFHAYAERLISAEQT